MTKYEMFDDYLAYNETLKQAVTWTVYGENDKYFLSKVYDFEDDFLEPLEDSENVLINVLITETDTLESLIEKSKNMVF